MPIYYLMQFDNQEEAEKIRLKEKLNSVSNKLSEMEKAYKVALTKL